MGQLPYWHSVELSAGARPVLREKEVDVLVENSIGLYQGKSKILNRQNGRIYMTSQRLIYIDNNDPKKYSVAIELADFKSVDYTARFLKSSPKITIFFSRSKNRQRKKKSNDQPVKTTTWICPICTFSNHVQSNINPKNEDYLPICETCGIKSTTEIIETALTSIKSNTPPPITPVLAPKQITCPTCTFLNHPSLRNCELCGSLLPINQQNNETTTEIELFDDRIQIKTESNDGLDESSVPFIKLSFHKNGDKFFLNKLNETLEKFKWEKVLNSGNANKDAKRVVSITPPTTTTTTTTSSRGFGIHSLAQQEELKTMKNEQIINSSLDDLQTLLNKANEILELTESFKTLNTSNQQEVVPNINQVTKELLTDPNNESQKKLYLQEISRQLSDFLVNDSVLDQEGGIITLIDLYALFNRGRVGINLISPEELYKSCEYFKELRLPLIFKKINNVLVVQDLKFGESSKIIEDIKKFIVEFGDFDQFSFKFSNILKISDAFNWSLTITEEILKIGLNIGDLVVDQQISGKFYYLNEFKELNSFSQTNYNEPLCDVADDGSTENLINETPAIEFPEAPKAQPFPEAPTNNVSTPKETSEHKSQSLLQLEGLQF